MEEIIRMIGVFDKILVTFVVLQRFLIFEI